MSVENKQTTMSLLTTKQVTLTKLRRKLSLQCNVDVCFEQRFAMFRFHFVFISCVAQLSLVHMRLVVLQAIKATNAASRRWHADIEML